MGVSLNMQRKLLRVLQEGEFERVGSTKTQKTNVRIICSTNVDLEKPLEIESSEMTFIFG